MLKLRKLSQNFCFLLHRFPHMLVAFNSAEIHSTLQTNAHCRHTIPPPNPHKPGTKFLFPAFCTRIYIYIYIYIYICMLVIYNCAQIHSTNIFANERTFSATILQMQLFTKLHQSFFFGFSPMVAVWNMHAFPSYFQTS